MPKITVNRLVRANVEVTEKFYERGHDADGRPVDVYGTRKHSVDASYTVPQTFEFRESRAVQNERKLKEHYASDGMSGTDALAASYYEALANGHAEAWLRDHPGVRFPDVI